MPHSRERLIAPVILKKLRFFPVVALQGARQTGKSYLASKILAKSIQNSKYISLDDLPQRNLCNESPSVFIQQNLDHKPIIIDEAQKAPPLFDAIKLQVDLQKTPGQFLLLGSTEFSKMTLIRESLTGRMGKIRIFPLTLTESLGRPNPSPGDLLRYLENGGLPGIYFVRDRENRDSLLKEWIELTCFRDIQQFKAKKLDGELAYLILRQSAILPEPTAPEIAKSLRINPKKCLSHLQALCELFVLERLLPHPSGTGKPIYLPFDTGIARSLGASLERLLHIWLLNEKKVMNSLQGSDARFFYYRSTNKRWVHLVIETPSRIEKSSKKTKHQAFQIICHENIKKPDAELMKAFHRKNKVIYGTILAPVQTKLKMNDIEIRPWISEALSKT